MYLQKLGLSEAGENVFRQLRGLANEGKLPATVKVSQPEQFNIRIQ